MNQMDFLIEQITEIVKNTRLYEQALRNLSENSLTTTEGAVEPAMNTNTVMLEQCKSINETLYNVVKELQYFNDKQEELLKTNQAMLDYLTNQSDSTKTRLVEEAPKAEAKKTTKTKTTKK